VALLFFRVGELWQFIAIAGNHFYVMRL